VIVKTNDFITFLKQVVDKQIGNYQEIYLPARGPDSQTGYLFFTSIREDSEFILNQYRTVDPVKILFYLAREQVLNKKYKNINRIVAGVKTCDLKAIQLLDKALINEEFIDPSYKHWRDHTTIITSDCDSVAPSCHCNLLDGKPYSEDGFDLNLSTIDDSYFITVGTQKGQKLFDLIKEYIAVKEPISDMDKIIQSNRKKVLQELVHQTKYFKDISTNHKLRDKEMILWEENSKQCVSCGACTNICPTCYCLILNDESDAKKFIKTRSYDSCQLYGYAKVAGGGTPRPRATERFRNRYLCKFSYMQSNFGTPGCTGCGRCIDACAAKLDIREVMHNINKNKASAVKQSLKTETVVRGEV
jgi:sulfhydrogenase subunit beta (sulfur reductase)